MTPAVAGPALQALIDSELDRPAPEAVQAVAAMLVARHGTAAVAILFYGSCRRSGDPTGLIDLTLLHDGHLAFHRHWPTALFNAILPPNVVSVRTPWAGRTLRAKVAIYSRRQFRRRMRAGSIDTTVWARFCQPASLLHARDAGVRQWVASAVAEGIGTARLWALRLARDDQTCWTALFEHTYGVELRPEPPGRAALIYAQDQAWFDAILPRFAPAGPRRWSAAWGVRRRWSAAWGVRRRWSAAWGVRRRWSAAWGARRMAGKALNVLRLVKAAFTFEGGADYIAWKIERHTGRRLELTAWQRRHPLLAAPALLWQLRFS